MGPEAGREVWLHSAAIEVPVRLRGLGAIGSFHPTGSYTGQNPCLVKAVFVVLGSPAPASLSWQCASCGRMSE